MKEDNIGLFIISTPIGNLEDITLRALRVLKEVDIILCEDTRHSIKLLNHYEIKNKLISYHKFNEKEMTEKILSFIYEDKKLALITDAGTPLVSDPGSVLVKELIENNISFTVLPGANALLPALILSGLDSERFSFIGFLPKKKGKKKEELEKFRDYKETLIFYSSPHDLKEVLLSMLEVFGDRKVSVSKEITKIHENTDRGVLSEIVKLYESKESIKGEFVVLVEGNKEEITKLSFEEIEDIFNSRVESGERAKDVIKDLAKQGGFKNRELYYKLMKK